MKKVKIILTLIFVVLIFSIGGIVGFKIADKGDDHYTPEKVQMPGKNNPKHQEIIDEKAISLYTEKMIQVTGFKDTGTKKLSYKDSPFKLTGLKINKDDSLGEKITKVGINLYWEPIADGTTDTVTRKYIQTGKYSVTYGVDAKKNPLKIISVNEKTGVVKMKKPVISELSFSMPYHKMEIYKEDKTDWKKGKIKLTKEFTEGEKQALYKRLYDSARSELKKKHKEEALEGTKEAIIALYKIKDKDIKVTFVD